MALGFRGLLELLYGWRAHVEGEAPPAPALSSNRTLRVRAYDGWSGQYLEDWCDISAVELVFDSHGPEQARLIAPATMPYWHHRRAMPGGRGVYLEIDARDWGLPIWTGRLVNPQPSSGAAELSAQLAGPRTWLERYHAAVGNPTTEPASRIVYHALEQVRPSPPTRMLLEGAYLGAGGREDLAARSLWELITNLAQNRGEWPYFTALPGVVEYNLEWRHPLGAPDLTGTVTLRDGDNSRWDALPEVDQKIEELLLVAQSWGIGSRVVGTKARASAVRAFGRKAALTAVVESAGVQNTTGSTQTVVDAAVPTYQSALVATEARLRRLVNSVIPARIEVLDPELWPCLRPGVLVSGRWDDPHGLFARSVVQIETMTVAPLSCQCQLSAWLWDVEP